jgi:hypothetical protein
MTISALGGEIEVNQQATDVRISYRIERHGRVTAEISQMTILEDELPEGRQQIPPGFAAIIGKVVPAVVETNA